VRLSQHGFERRVHDHVVESTPTMPTIVDLPLASMLLATIRVATTRRKRRRSPPAYRLGLIMPLRSNGMAQPESDPYRTLGVRPNATDAELRMAYRHLVQLHHPDHNGGAPESARRFEEIQDAYAQIRERRNRTPRATEPPPHAPMDPGVESRLEDLEREVREAIAARDRARRAAAEAAAATQKRPTDEELGRVETDDSVAKILGDARAEFSERLAQAAEHPVGKRVSELIDELEAKLTGKGPRDARD
jgi:hypothetical protein